MKICQHKNKKATDSYNYDMEIYWDCPDCGEGWRAKPITEREIKMANKISDKYDALDAKAMGIKI
jgi:hypothetical protein